MEKVGGGRQGSWVPVHAESGVRLPQVISPFLRTVKSLG